MYGDSNVQEPLRKQSVRATDARLKFGLIALVVVCLTVIGILAGVLVNNKSSGDGTSTPPPPPSPTPPPAGNSVYTLTVSDNAPKPILSSQFNSEFLQVFNPSWVQASAGTNQVAGLLIRTQNCSYIQGQCLHCGGDKAKASIITFTKQLTVDPPTFEPVTAKSVVFGPSDKGDEFGTEDPRMQFDEATGIYYMFYTAFGSRPSGEHNILLSLASTTNPTVATAWTRHGAIFPQTQGSKSGALLIAGKTNGLKVNHLFWGDTQIRHTTSSNLTQWTSEGEIFLSPR